MRCFEFELNAAAGNARAAGCKAIFVVRRSHRLLMESWAYTSHAVLLVRSVGVSILLIRGSP